MVRLATVVAGALTLLTAVHAVAIPTREVSDLTKRAWWDDDDWDENDRVCIDNWRGAIHYKYIFFEDPADTSVTYSISTQWYITYDDRIRDALRDEGFDVLDDNPGSKCGWWVADKVRRTAVTRGYIQYQSRNSNSNNNNDDDDNSNNNNDDDDNDRDRNDDDFRSADRDVVERAQDILRDHYPGVEIGVICGVVAVAVLLGLAVVCCCGSILAGLCGRRRY